MKYQQESRLLRAAFFYSVRKSSMNWIQHALHIYAAAFLSELSAGDGTWLGLFITKSGMLALEAGLRWKAPWEREPASAFFSRRC